MCCFCKEGNFFPSRSVVVLERGAKKITVHNVEGFTCNVCGRTMYDEKVISQLESMAGKDGHLALNLNAFGLALG